jgi:hypothetical protein
LWASHSYFMLNKLVLKLRSSHLTAFGGLSLKVLYFSSDIIFTNIHSTSTY